MLQSNERYQFVAYKMQVLRGGTMIWNLILACGVEEKEITPNEGEVIVEDVDGDGYTDSEDCNDEDANIFPDAAEICDGLDNNCDGQVDEDEILPPGTRTTVGWFDNFMERQSDEMPLFYLIDRRPIPIFTNIEISVGNSIHNIHAMIQTHIVGSLNNKESLMIFIDQLVEGKDSLNRRDICSKIQSKIQQELKRSILKSGPNMQMAEENVTQILNQSIGRNLGLQFTIISTSRRGEF